MLFPGTLFAVPQLPTPGMRTGEERGTPKVSKQEQCQVTQPEKSLFIACATLLSRKAGTAAMKFFYTHEMSRRLRVERRMHWLTGQKLAFTSHLSCFSQELSPR